MSLRANAETASILSSTSRAPTTAGTSRNLQLFTLETFSSKDFIVKDFIETLSESAHATRRSAGQSITPGQAPTSQQAFDPKPLIRTFEHALSRLKTLSEDLEVRENELSLSVRRAEGQHNSNIKSRERELERAIDNFHRLERTLDGDGDAGGNVAMRIGERLEELDKQRQRAQDAKFILQCWLEVSERGDLAMLEDVRKTGGGDGKVRCAYIARQLLRISQRLDPGANRNSNSHQTNGVHFANGTNGDHEDGYANGGSRSRRNGKQPRELIEKFLEKLEKDLLKSFDDFYRRQNFDGMRECALALRDFSDGNSVISLFVNQHQFFIDRAQLVTEDLATDTDIWDRLADPDTEPPGVEPSLQSLIDEVKMVTQEESYILKRAFPYYEEVLSRFIQRVFQQSVQQRLELVLNKADDISSLSFLRSLQASRSCIAGLVEDLKSHGLTEHPEPASSTVAAVLDQQLDELFVPYFTGTSYIEREKRNLGELYEGLLFKFTMYHSRRRKVNISTNTYLARGKEFVSNVRENYVERLNNMDLPAGQKTIMLRLAGMHDKEHSATAQKEIDITDEDGQLSLPFTKRMLKWLAEGVGRGLELAGGNNETPKEVRELLQLLIANMGEIYLETALDAMSDAAVAAEQNTRSEPDINYLADLRAAVSVLHLMLTTIQMLLLPLAASNLTIRRDLEKQTSTFVERMESKIDAILQRTIDAALAWTARLLSQQKKTDFRPKDDTNIQLDRLSTPTCQSIYTFLSRLHSRARTALSAGRVLESFSLELAVGMRALLLNHFKSYQVNLTGGLIVSKDITRYIELFKSWDLDASFEPSLEVLTEIASIFVIGPEALRDRLRNVGGAAGLVGIEKGDLRPFVLRREDAGSVGVQAVLSGL